MANTIINRILQNGPRDLITEHALISSTGVAGDNEGTLAAPVSKLFTPLSFTAATLSIHLKVRRIIYNISPNCEVAVLWVATTMGLIANLQGFGDYDLQDTQGIINDAGAGATGDIAFFTQFPAAATTTFPAAGGYTIVLEMIKGT